MDKLSARAPVKQQRPTANHNSLAYRLTDCVKLSICTCVCIWSGVSTPGNALISITCKSRSLGSIDYLKSRSAIE